MEGVFIIQTWGDHEHLGIEAVFKTREEAENYLLEDKGLTHEGDGVFIDESPWGDHYTIEYHLVKGRL